MLRALRNANLFLQNEREISAGLMEKLLKLDHSVAERFYALYREQFNRDLTVPDAVVEEWIPWERLEQKKKSPPDRNSRRLDVCRRSPLLIIKVKPCALPEKHNIKKQDLTPKPTPKPTCAS